MNSTVRKSKKANKMNKSQVNNQEQSTNDNNQNNSESTDSSSSPPSSPRRKFEPKTLKDALENHSTVKSLLSLEKFEKNSEQPHYKLVASFIKLMFSYQQSNKIDFTKTLSPFLSFVQNVSSDVFFDKSFLKSVSYFYPDLESAPDCATYLKLAYALVKVVNANILNNVVYVEKKNISKFKLFNIVEQVLFTQVVPSEVNDNESDFKLELCNLVKDLRLSAVATNKRKQGAGDQQPTSDQQPSSDQQPESTVDSTTTQPSQ